MGVGAALAACGGLLLSRAAPREVPLEPLSASVSVPPAVLPEPVPEVLPLAAPAPVQVAALTDLQFGERMKQSVREVGSISIGRANRGYLFNGVQLEEDPLWHVVEPKFSWGTATTVAAIQTAIREVNRIYPGTPRLHVGHISKQRGGWLRPHRSHQSGRDVDIGFYYSQGSMWYKRATAENLDVARTWALLSALHKASPLEYAFVDRSLQPLLRQEAERVGESPQFVRDMFDGEHRGEPILRHARGHDDHLHVRFASVQAVTNATRAIRNLGKRAYNRASMLSMLETRAKKQARAAKIGKSH